MSNVIVKITFPQALDLLYRWFVTKGGRNDKTLRIDTMNMLRATGRIPKSFPAQAVATDAKGALKE